ncbi:MAG: sensor histidine kinase [Solirubrobacteraceae bacterium]
MRSIGRQPHPRSDDVQQNAVEGWGMRAFAAGDLDFGTPGPAEARMRPVAPSALAIAVVTGILITLALLRPVHGLDAGARAAAETAIIASAALAARLLIDTFSRSRQLRELLLILGVLALSLAEFSYWAGPAVAGVRSPASAGALRLAWELIGALALVAAALVSPTTRVNKTVRRHARAAALVGLGLAAFGTLLAQVIAAHSEVGTAGATPTGIVGHPVAMAVQATVAAILAFAALAFVAGSWRAEKGTGLVAGAALLLAAAGLRFLAAPTVAADWITPDEGVRLAAYVFLLGAAYLRNAQVQRHEAYTTICAERERIARDLHDGLAQDLACITTQAQRFDCRLGPEDPLMLATRDALAELRGMIADLTASTVPTSEAAVRLVAHELGHRLDVQVNVRSDVGSMPTVDDRLDLAPRDDLIRAARQAILQAALRDDARQVDVALLRRAGTLVVRVSGDGSGGPLTRPAGSGQARPAGSAPRNAGGRGVSRLAWERPRRVKLRRPA